MSLQFADFDADGHEDIVTATFEGHAFVVRGSEDGWRAPEHLLDASGRKLVLSLFYDMEANGYANAERSPEGARYPGDHCVSAQTMDWDGDGDLDVLLGAKEGRLYLRENIGEDGANVFADTNLKLEAGGEELMVPGGLTGARPVDWNGDGLTDLVCGSFTGGAYVFRNTGTRTAPTFAAPVEILPGAPEGTNGPARDWYVDVVDYDLDGDLDLLVGGQYTPVVEERELTAEEAARLAELDERMAGLQDEMTSHWEALDAESAGLSDEERQAKMDALYESEAYQELMERYMACMDAIQELRPFAGRESGVWLYRNETEG